MVMECVRIISMVSEVTQEKEEANKEVDADILKANAVHQTGLMAKKGGGISGGPRLISWLGGGWFLRKILWRVLRLCIRL